MYILDSTNTIIAGPYTHSVGYEVARLVEGATAHTTHRLKKWGGWTQRTIDAALEALPQGKPAPERVFRAMAILDEAGYHVWGCENAQYILHKANYAVFLSGPAGVFVLVYINERFAVVVFDRYASKYHERQSIADTLNAQLMEV